MTQRSTRIRRHPERSAPDALNSILQAGLVAHVGYILDNEPYVIPFSYFNEPNDTNILYLHGSSASQTLRALRNGATVCVSIAIADGIVYSKTAINHSMNYRSAVGYGKAEVMQDLAEIAEMFDRWIGKYTPGRQPSIDYRRVDDEMMRGTVVLKAHIASWSVKARSGGSREEDDENPAVPGTSGVIDISQF